MSERLTTPETADHLKQAPAGVVSRCPTCGGDGWVVEIVDRNWGNPYGEQVQEHCPDCDGGWVTENVTRTLWEIRGSGSDGEPLYVENGPTGLVGEQQVTVTPAWARVVEPGDTVLTKDGAVGRVTSMHMMGESRVSFAGPGAPSRLFRTSTLRLVVPDIFDNPRRIELEHAR